MTHGILLRTDGTVYNWTWADHSTTFPGEFPVTPGDRLIDLSRHTNAEAQQVIALCAKMPAADREALLSGYPTITISDVPAPPAGHEAVCQPGYRRIAHRPTAEHHEQETAARIRANTRLANGEQLSVVIEEEFTHLSDRRERADRIGRALPTQQGHARFPLTPLVALSAHQTMTSVQTVRTFPFHLIIAEI